MKILLVNDYKETIAGAEIYMQTLKEALEKKGHTVRIFGSDKTKEEYILSQKDKSVLSYLKKLFNFESYLKFQKTVSDFKPDIIHLQNIFNELSPSILLAAKSTPMVMTVHDSQLVNSVSILSERTGKECKKRTCGGCMNCVGLKGAMYEFVKRKFHKLLLNKIKLFITPSQYMRGLIQEAGFHPVITIPNGIKILSYSRIRNFNKLLYVGRLTKDKGIEFLLRAIPTKIEKFSNVKLTLVGDGVDKKYFLNLTKELKIQKSIRFIGSVNREDIEKYYINSTIVVLPSIYHDNFPTVCIEAMSVGRPIIGTNLGGIPELVVNDKSGFIIQSRNSAIIAKKAIELLSNRRLLNQMSGFAAKRSKQFLLKRHADEIEEIYNKLKFIL
jgi:glycosyltransferase involved in cell wall biosynthesis